MSKLEAHICPVCSKHSFRCVDSFEICPVCGWWNEAYCEDYPDDGGAENTVSLNEARANFEKCGRADPVIDAVIADGHEKMKEHEEKYRIEYEKIHGK